MSWWGKLIGGAFGFVLGGPLGALLGAALGHSLDSGIKNLHVDGVDWSGGDTERVQAAFFTAVFSVMGHLAKADGRVSESEIQAARQIMDRMQLDDDQKRLAMGLFNQGKQPDFDLESVLDQFRKECHRRTNLLQMFLEILIVTALADLELHESEQKVLFQVADRIGFHRRQFEQLLAMAAAQQRYAGQHRQQMPQQPKGPTLEEAYQALGVEPSATDGELKKAYRRLMSQHHPDKLVAKGLPEEMIKMATEKTQEIRAAYEQIKRAREAA
ncbi:co-chaperone DjlA [Hahella ganghwensis]|uniref:co-chaperone DjlA n=1 Tax=Hahella ganghwensis TaxID=286420 RepID=UPI0003695F61|nr:co-chaperone DjlA [Hahella ganghwensis]